MPKREQTKPTPAEPDLSEGYPKMHPPRVIVEYMVRDVIGQSTLEIQNYLNDLALGGWYLSLIFGTRFIFSRHVGLADALSVEVQK